MTNFLVRFVRDTIEYRKKNGIVRNDFLNLLMNVQEEEEMTRNKVKNDVGRFSLSRNNQHPKRNQLARRVAIAFNIGIYL